MIYQTDIKSLECSVQGTSVMCSCMEKKGRAQRFVSFVGWPLNFSEFYNLLKDIVKRVHTWNLYGQLYGQPVSRCLN